MVALSVSSGARLLFGVTSINTRRQRARRGEGRKRSRIGGIVCSTLCALLLSKTNCESSWGRSTFDGQRLNWFTFEEYVFLGNSSCLLVSLQHQHCCQKTDNLPLANTKHSVIDYLIGEIITMSHGSVFLKKWAESLCGNYEYVNDWPIFFSSKGQLEPPRFSKRRIISKELKNITYVIMWQPQIQQYRLVLSCSSSTPSSNSNKASKNTAFTTKHRHPTAYGNLHCLLWKKLHILQFLKIL